VGSATAVVGGHPSHSFSSVGGFAAFPTVPQSSFSGFAAFPTVPQSSFSGFAAFPTVPQSSFSGGYSALQTPGASFANQPMAAPQVVTIHPHPGTPGTTAGTPDVLSQLLGPGIIQGLLGQLLRCPPGVGQGPLLGGTAALSEAALRDLIDARLDARLKKTEDRLDAKLDQIINDLKKYKHDKPMRPADPIFSTPQASPTAERNRAEMRRVLAEAKPNRLAGRRGKRSRPGRAFRPGQRPPRCADS